jgi:hypothetical protein
VELSRCRISKFPKLGEQPIFRCLDGSVESKVDQLRKGMHRVNRRRGYYVLRRIKKSFTPLPTSSVDPFSRPQEKLPGELHFGEVTAAREEVEYAIARQALQ